MSWQLRPIHPMTQSQVKLWPPEVGLHVPLFLQCTVVLQSVIVINVKNGTMKHAWVSNMHCTNAPC